MYIFSDVIKLNCIYQYNGLVKDEYNWHGYAILDFNDLNFDIKSLTIDEIDNQSIRKIPERYLFGINGLKKKDDTIEFIVLSGKHCPFDYRFKYDLEDDCFYGLWYYINTYDLSSSFGGYAKLEVTEDYEQNKVDLEKEILKWENSEYYERYLEIINDVFKDNKPNIAVHEESLEEQYHNAKKYFHSINKRRIK